MGGKRGLQALSPDGVTLALQLPVVFGGTEKTGAKRRRDAVVNVRGVTLVNEDESAFLLNANTQYRLLEKRLAGFDAFSGKGLLLTGAAELLYEDYNRGSAMTRQETLQALRALMDKAGQAGPLLLPRANAYALPYADFLTEMPEGGSGYALLGESVPFYYLVVNGSIPYALETAGNLSPDLQKNQAEMARIRRGALFPAQRGKQRKADGHRRRVPVFHRLRRPEGFGRRRAPGMGGPAGKPEGPAAVRP